MAITQRNGIQLVDENIIISPNRATWADLGAGTDYPTWADWNDWAEDPEDLVWTTDIVDLGEITAFTLEILTEGSGDIEYKVHTSDSGLFNGEETTVDILAGDNVEAFSGKLFYIETRIIANGSVPTLRSQSFTSSNEVFRKRILNLNTAILPGAASTKELEELITWNYSKIVTMIITPLQPGGYVEADYWADTYTEVAPPVFPNIVSKEFGNPRISLATYEGIYTEGACDVEVVYMPGITLQEDGNLVRI